MSVTARFTPSVQTRCTNIGAFMDRPAFRSLSRLNTQLTSTAKAIGKRLNEGSAAAQTASGATLWSADDHRTRRRLGRRLRSDTSDNIVIGADQVVGKCVESELPGVPHRPLPDSGKNLRIGRYLGANRGIDHRVHVAIAFG